MSKAMFILSICCAMARAAGKDFTQDISVYYGTSDVSAAVAVNKHTFIWPMMKIMF